MIKQHFNVKSKITALVLVVMLIVGAVPISVSAAQTSANYTLMEGMNSDADIKFVELGNTDKQLAVMLMDTGEGPEYCRQLYYSIARDGSVSVPRSIKDDNTTDLQPFVYSQSETSSKKDIIITWTEADKEFELGTPTDEDDLEKMRREIASSMRIGIAVLNSENLNLPFGAYNINVGKNDSTDEDDNTGKDGNVCYYKSRITKLDGKILITWAVCNNVEKNDGFFSVEGMYYNPTDNTFSTDTNKKDDNGNLIPMFFVKNRNYISDYSVASINGKTAVLFQEATDGTRISKEMYSAAIDKKSTYPFTVKESDKNRDLNLAVSGSVTTLAPSGKYSSLVESTLPYLSYYYNGNLYTVSPTSSTPEGWRATPVLDVSETGDTKYSFIIKNNVVQYISALELTPLKTDNASLTYCGKIYTKTEDGKWIDEKGETAELYQHVVRLYYRGAGENQMTLLPLPLLDTGENFVTCMPSFIIDSENRLATIWAHGKIRDGYVTLYYTRYSQDDLLKANYKAVNEAVAKANGLNAGDYSNFSIVSDAINSVVYDKMYTEQSVVNDYAVAIENAMGSLILRSADYTDVDAAVSRANALDENLYKNFDAVKEAINAVDRSKNFKAQAEVDLMAKAIKNALAALEYKDADYSKVDEAIAKAQAFNRDEYKDFSKVDEAVNAVVRGKNITQQAEVDLMANGINESLDALEKKTVQINKNPEVKTENKSEQKSETNLEQPVKGKAKSPNTGSPALAVYAALASSAVCLLFIKKRKN